MICSENKRKEKKGNGPAAERFLSLLYVFLLEGERYGVIESFIDLRRSDCVRAQGKESFMH